MLKQKYFLTDFFILSAEKQPIKLSWRNIEWLQLYKGSFVAFKLLSFIGSICFLLTNFPAYLFGFLLLLLFLFLLRHDLLQGLDRFGCFPLEAFVVNLFDELR